jgi:hypothetical protein
VTDERGDFRDRCPDEGTLVGYLDGAVASGRREGVAAHLAGCRICRARLAEIRTRDELVREWLRRHDPPPPPWTPASHDPRGPHPSSGRGFSRRQWAAATAAAVAVVALAGPAFGWVTARIQDVLPPGEAPEAPAPPQEVPAVTSFRPAGTEFELSFEARGTRGRLHVQPAPDSLLALEVPSTRIGLTIHRGRVEIHNLGKPEGSYRLLVPAGVERLVIVVAGDEPRRLALPADRDGFFELPFTPGR